MTKLEQIGRAIEVKSNYVISQHHAKALAMAAVEELRYVGYFAGDFEKTIDAILNEKPKQRDKK